MITYNIAEQRDVRKDAGFMYALKRSLMDERDVFEDDDSYDEAARLEEVLDLLAQGFAVQVHQDIYVANIKKRKLITKEPTQ